MAGAEVVELYGSWKRRSKYVAQLYGESPPQNPLERFDRAYNNTFLHLAIRFRQTELVLLLIRNLGEGESLSNIKNDDDNTILHELAGQDSMIFAAMSVVDKDPGLLSAVNKLGLTPIFVAARHGQFFMFFILAHELQLRYPDMKTYLERGDKTTVLHVAVIAEHFELAYNIARRFEDLVAEKDQDGMTAFQYLACNQRAFERKQKPRRGFLEDKLDNALRNDQTRKDKLQEIQQNGPHRFQLQQLVEIMAKKDIAWLGVDYETTGSSETPGDYDHTTGSSETKEGEESEIQEKNMQGHEDQKILEQEGTKLVESKNILELPKTRRQKCDEFKKGDESPLFLAIMSNIPEIVKEILRCHPKAINYIRKDGMNILQAAIIYRNIEIFELIVTIEMLPSHLLSAIDENGNSLLHIVGRNQRSPMDESMQNPAIQLGKECTFFQKVKAECSMHVTKPLNKCHQTAEELFAIKNRNLYREAKEWLMRTTENCTILSVFISTVAFAAAYTVPGGPDQNTGIPLLNGRPWFMLFIVADVISLALALTSVGIFLSILTSSFPLHDFKNSVFKKLKRGIISMVLSISMMAVAFGATIVLNMTHNWESVVWIVVGFLPVPILFLSYSPLRSAVLRVGAEMVQELLITFVSKFLGCCEEIAKTFGCAVESADTGSV